MNHYPESPCWGLCVAALALVLIGFQISYHPWLALALLLSGFACWRAVRRLSEN